MPHLPAGAELCASVSVLVAAVGIVTRILTERANAVLVEYRSPVSIEFLVFLANQKRQVRQLCSNVINLAIYNRSDGVQMVEDRLDPNITGRRVPSLE